MFAKFWQILVKFLRSTVRHVFKVNVEYIDYPEVNVFWTNLLTKISIFKQIFQNSSGGFIQAQVIRLIWAVFCIKEF